MKILFFRESEIKNLNPEIAENLPFGATETCIIHLAKELAKKHIVAVYCPNKEQKIYDSVTYVPYKSYSDFFIYCKKIEPDLVIVVGNPSILFKNLIPDYNYVFWQHNHPAEMKQFPITSLLQKNIKIVFPSPESAEFSKKYYHNTENIFGIYNGIRSLFFNEFSIKDKNRIIYTGALYRHKGVLELLKCVPHLPDYNFYICGSFDMYGNENLDFKKECLEFSTYLNLHFLGGLNQNQLVHELQKSELCIVNPLIGNKEVCCVTALEAMASGVPVIAGGQSIIDDIISKGGISYTRDLVQTIKDLMNDERRRTLLSINGKDWATELSWSKISKLWNEFLKDHYE